MKILVEAARYLVGGLFIFSGIIKVNDPVGTAIKLEEYFEVFAYDIAPFFEWFIPAALFLSVFLSVLEVALGIALILGFQIKVTSKILLGLIVFFTFLTFYSAYFNKVTDCGCFGDAIKLTPWQSFYKDIILTVLIVVIFIGRKKIKPFLPAKLVSASVVLSTVVLIFLAIYAIQHLPFIDFRSYAVSNSIPKLMQPSGELKYSYIMEKDGKEYTFPTYPTDNSYTFKSVKTLNPEVQPKITDLSIWNNDGEFTDEMLSGNKLLFIFHDVEKASKKHIEDLNKLATTLKGIEIWALTSSGYESFEAFRHDQQLGIPYFFGDATVLKTMIRSNPGVMQLQNGVVLGKWHHNDIPSISDIQRLAR